VFRNRPHEQGRDAVSDARPPVAIAAGELKRFRIGSQRLDLGDGQFPQGVWMDEPQGSEPFELREGKAAALAQALCMPRLPSLRRIILAGLRGSNFTALHP